MKNLRTDYWIDVKFPLIPHARCCGVSFQRAIDRGDASTRHRVSFFLLRLQPGGRRAPDVDNQHGRRYRRNEHTIANPQGEGAFASDGSYWIGQSCCLRKVTGGVVSSPVGNCADCSTNNDGQSGTAVRMSGAACTPVTVGTDVWFTQSATHVIRKMDLATLTVTTVAGQLGTSAADNSARASGTAGTFATPRWLSTDGSNYVWVTGQSMHCVREIAVASPHATSTRTGTCGSTGGSPTGGATAAASTGAFNSLFGSSFQANGGASGVLWLTGAGNKMVSSSAAAAQGRRTGCPLPPTW